MDIDDTLDDLAPQAKRRRLSSGCPASFSSHATRTPLQKLWFPDGDIVLEIESRLLKVHRARLECSAIFADMLSLPQPPDAAADYVDGCPFVLLAGDALADWEVALAWMYHTDLSSRTPTPPWPPSQHSPPPSVSALNTRSPRSATGPPPPSPRATRSTSSPSPCIATADAAHAIPLFRACRLEPLLPAAFYALSLQSFSPSSDSSTASQNHSLHRILDPTDMQRLLAGREALHDALVCMLVDPLGRFDSDFRCACAPHLESYWRAGVAPPRSSTRTCLLRVLAGMLQDDTFVGTLCGGSAGSPSGSPSRGHGGDEGQDDDTPMSGAHDPAHDDGSGSGGGSESGSGRRREIDFHLNTNASGCAETHLRLVRWRLAQLRDGIQGVRGGGGFFML
ncbi:hypothetical protein B0H11DRAFT_1994564 [Mycena galericulata]|nr:hypothetical protein B0H11DRAFT_1994564 [Mycena galericulata]